MIYKSQKLPKTHASRVKVNVYDFFSCPLFMMMKTILCVKLTKIIRQILTAILTYTNLK